MMISIRDCADHYLYELRYNVDTKRIIEIFEYKDRTKNEAFEILIAHLGEVLRQRQDKGTFYINSL